MKLEKQLVNKGLSQELEKAGYPQEGIWWWVWTADNGWLLWNDRHMKNEIRKCMTYFVAPTVAELGEVLPEEINGYEFSVVRDERGWAIVYFDDLSETHMNDMNLIFANTEANARAKMWLYLKKEGKL